MAAEVVGGPEGKRYEMHSSSAARLAKVCTGILLVGVLAIAAYEVLSETVDGPNAAVLTEGSAANEQADFSSGQPDALAFGETDDDSTTAKTDDDDESDKSEADGGPQLKIVEPIDGSRYTTPNVVFQGTSEPGSSVSSGPYAANVGTDGSWQIALVLSPGGNGAKITARDSAGNVSEASITVWLDAASVPPVTKPAPVPGDPGTPGTVDVAFSANQKYGSCEEELAYDKFWGTATPDTALTITSPYGGAEVEVDEYGNWEKKVFFPDAPVGEDFTVTVTAVNGSKSFSFISLGPPGSPVT